MANDLNKFQCIGRLGKDPEVTYTPGGDAVANFSVALSESWADKQTGQKQERTTWVRIVAWRKLGEICGQYLRKGSQVYIEGKLVIRKYIDQNQQEKHATEIIANNLQMLGDTPTGQQQGRQPPAQQAQPPRQQNYRHKASV